MSDWSGMESCVKMVALFGLLSFISLTAAAAGDVFFPAGELQGDFRPSIPVFALPDSVRQDRSIVQSFNPQNPSPTLAAVEPFGVSQVRFIESDALIANPIVDKEAEQSAPATQTVPVDGLETSPRFLSGALPVIQAVPDSSPKLEDRWPWPSSSPVAPQSNRLNGGRQLNRPELAEATQDVAASDEKLIIKKSVPKPYRILTQVSSCPKLFHDLSISCQMSHQQQQGQPVLFQWSKTIFNQNVDTLIKNRVLDPPVKLPITYGSHLQTKDPRYGVSTTFDSTTLTIKQLKVSDCGSYTCEASFANGTVISSSDLMIFLCF